MAKARCVNCGMEMLTLYSASGLRVYVCPEVRSTAVKSIKGIPIHTEIHCRVNIQGLRAAFEQLTADANINIEELREATRQMISDADLYENANLAIMLGLPKSQLVDLFEAAFKLAMGVGIKPIRGIEALCKGVGRRSRLILDNIGITFKPSDAYEWFKGVNALEKLTTDQKTIAWQHYAIHQIEQKADGL